MRRNSFEDWNNEGFGPFSLPLASALTLASKPLVNAVSLLSDIAPEIFGEPLENEYKDLTVTDDAVIMQIPCPGCRKEDIDVKIVGNSLKLRVDYTHAREVLENTEGRVIKRERLLSSREITRKLPVPVIGAEAKASYTDGVMTLTMPRLSKTEPESRTVNVD